MRVTERTERSRLKGYSNVSYNTDEPTKEKAAIAAMVKGINVSELVRLAIREFAGSLEPKTVRNEGFTVVLSREDSEIIKATALKTGRKSSVIIHECLSMYVMAHNDEFKEFMRIKMEQANRVLAA